MCEVEDHSISSVSAAMPGDLDRSMQDDDLLRPNPHVHPLADESDRDRVQIRPELYPGPIGYGALPELTRFETGRWQRKQVRLFMRPELPDR